MRLRISQDKNTFEVENLDAVTPAYSKWTITLPKRVNYGESVLVAMQEEIEQSYPNAEIEWV